MYVAFALFFSSDGIHPTSDVNIILYFKHYFVVELEGITSF